jgi:predicted O-linked N-acetylglucosamine transferase (SPINDLY family)
MAPLDAGTPTSFIGLPLEMLMPGLEAMPAAGAIAAYRAWLAANPASPQRFAAWFNVGAMLGGAGDRAGAMAAYRQALALKPDLHQASVNLGLALETDGRIDDALALWGAALQPDAARIALLNQRGRLLEAGKRYAEAEHALRASLLTDPQQPDVVQHWVHLRQKGCTWPELGNGLPGLSVREMSLQTGPLGALALTDSPAMQRRIGEAWIARKVPAAPQRLSPTHGYTHDRIRVGYLSSDFCRHAMGFLIVELLERHDRTQFEVFGYCSTQEDGSELRRRILAALDHHIPIGHLSEEEAARHIRADEIDILIDLNGLTAGARLGALRWKPAPVQATYLGYVGPVPLPELDWMICDDVVVPADQAEHYLPRPLPIKGCYQANDARPPILPVVTRESEGLPQQALVFCCFNNFYKITPRIFTAWLSILRTVPDSVLWLTEDNATGIANLRDLAGKSGVTPDRLIFASRCEPERYLARLGLADLFLDTFPYNAGTVASDALRMGLPIITCTGRSFASRMASSLMTAVGATGGITSNLHDYVGKAIALAKDPAARAAARCELAGDAWTQSLGDTAAFAARMEAVYRSICLRP